jgi:hypothetical protein
VKEYLYSQILLQLPDYLHRCWFQISHINGLLRDIQNDLDRTSQSPGRTMQRPSHLDTDARRIQRNRTVRRVYPANQLAVIYSLKN